MSDQKNAIPSGILVVDKPRGVSSHDVVARVRRLFGLRKVGHAGTLDPEATGVMVVALGNATRLLEYYTDQEKSYSATLRLGQISTTGDAEGDLTTLSTGPWPTNDDVEAVLTQFRGAIQQTPPIYSALKIDGERLYKKARRGESVEIPSRSIFIYDLFVESSALPEIPELTIFVRCSKGTYIRTLGEDIGNTLKTGAYLTSLRRVASGKFSLEQSYTFEQLEAFSEDDRSACLLPVGFGLPPERCIEVKDVQWEEIRHGRLVDGIVIDSDMNRDQELFAYRDNRLCAVLAPRDNGLYKPRKVFL